MGLETPIQWAQRKDRLILTVDLQDCKDPKIDLSNDDAEHFGKFSFSGKAVSHATGAEPHDYSLQLDFYGEIVPEESKINKTSRYIQLAIAKKATGHWPRLLKQAGKPPLNIKVDWNRWVDEDEEDEVKDDFDLGKLQDFTQFADKEDIEPIDSDDEDLPDLEK